VLRFLDERASLADIAAIIWSMPKAVFLRGVASWIALRLGLFRPVRHQLSRRALLTFIAALSASLLLPPAARAEKAPWFTLPATSGATRTPASYAGRVALLMYEDRDSRSVNAALKDEVKRRIDGEGLAGQLVVVPIADLRKYDYWPARAVVRRAVSDEARTLGAEILLDWKGDVLRSYGFAAPGSNVVLLGKDGSLLYRRTAPLDAAERRRFHQLLSRALAATS
jgi:hypothetical protein